MLNVKLLKVGDKLPVNQDMAGLVPMASEREQSALTDDISNNGLKEPIVLWRGEIVDGRCRQLACTISNTAIMARELDNELTENEVRIFVKSVNTRRNLTLTQKVMSACRESIVGGSGSLIKISKSWGISTVLLNNARYITKNNPEFSESLFNGYSVPIVNSRGEGVKSNKVSSVYAFIKRENESVKRDDQYGWSPCDAIKTQAGKEWFYREIDLMRQEGEIRAEVNFSELANYKYPLNKKDDKNEQ